MFVQKGNYEYELELGNYLFFPFSSTIDNDIIQCADNISRNIRYTGNCLAETDCIGYLAIQEHDTITFFSAIYLVGDESEPDVVWRASCGLIDDAMSIYLKTFIK